MKIYDCFMYNNEKLILDLRLNHLNEYTEKFSKTYILRPIKKVNKI